MTRHALVFLICIALPPSVAVAIHEEQGAVNDASPVLTIGSPTWPDSVYSGISLRILPGAPADLRFTRGEATWAGVTDATIVDTELEQSIFLLDSNSKLTLAPNPEPNFADFGLVIGDLIPSEFYGPFPNGLGPSHLDPFIEVNYRLIGSDEILSGSIQSFAFVPEPGTYTMMCVGIFGCLRLAVHNTRQRGDRTNG